MSAPQACTLSKQHPCIYYGGDINAGDPEENGLSDENSLFISNSYTYTEVKVPVAAHFSASFANLLNTYGVIDPKTAEWSVRTGVSEGQGGTSICSGDNPATFNPTGRNAFGFNENELPTSTPCTVPVANVWIAIVPNCTNANDGDCTNDPRYFISDTNGPNAINGQYTVTSNTGMGPTWNSPTFFSTSWASWCNDEGVACGDGLSLGVLR